MPQGVIFDMDGVLVASGPAHLASWKLVARKSGVEFTDQQFSASFGQTSRDIIRTFWGENLSDEEIRSIDDRKEAVYRDLIEDLVPLTIGVREMLQHLAADGLVLSVATSGPPENLKAVIDATGLNTHFRVQVHGRDVAHGKPAPDVFLLAAERCGLKPEDCVVVEDAPAGVEAGVAAGMPVIGLVGTHPAEPLAAAGAIRTVDTLSAITPDLVRRLLSD